MFNIIRTLWELVTLADIEREISHVNDSLDSCIRTLREVNETRNDSLPVPRRPDRFTPDSTWEAEF